MHIRLKIGSATLFAFILKVSTVAGGAQTIVPLCHPSVTGPVTVATHDQIVLAGERAEPPITDTAGFGFAWPDTQMGVIKTGRGYQFFSSDGGLHSAQNWRGQSVGNGKYGGAVTTTGTLDNPLGQGNPRDVSIASNPDPGVNPNYPSYSYLGGGPVFRVPEGRVGAGMLLMGYHAELPSDTLYSVHGLAASWDDGLNWIDLGEIVRPNQSYAPAFPNGGFDEVGDGPLVLSPDGKYFYFYFPDWPAGTAVTTSVSVARAPAASVLDAAFRSRHPHTVAFEKFYQGSWSLQPGIGGAATDLIPNSPYRGYLDVHFSSALLRYVMITSDNTNFGYAESVDGLHWSTPIRLGSYGSEKGSTQTIAPYPTSVGLGENPSILGKSFYIFYARLQLEGGGLPRKGDSVQRLTLTCK